jgi:hypothetical protein
MLSLFVKAFQQYGNRDVIRFTPISYAIDSINGDHFRHCNIHKTLQDYVTFEHLLDCECWTSVYVYSTLCCTGRACPAVLQQPSS